MSKNNAFKRIIILIKVVNYAKFTQSQLYPIFFINEYTFYWKKLLYVR